MANWKQALLALDARLGIRPVEQAYMWFGGASVFRLDAYVLENIELFAAFVTQSVTRLQR